MNLLSLSVNKSGSASAGIRFDSSIFMGLFLSCCFRSSENCDDFLFPLELLVNVRVLFRIRFSVYIDFGNMWSSCTFSLSNCGAGQF